MTRSAPAARAKGRAKTAAEAGWPAAEVDPSPRNVTRAEVRELNKWLRELKKKYDENPWPEDWEDTPLPESKPGPKSGPKSAPQTAVQPRPQPGTQPRPQPGQPGQPGTQPRLREDVEQWAPQQPKEAPKSLPPCSRHYDPDAICWLGDSPPPIWVPVGEGAAFVPTDVRHAAITLVQPFYEEHVNNSDDSIERMLATTVAYLMWMELLEQHDQKREYSHVESVIGLAGHRGSIIEQQLKIIDRKLRIASFFLKLREQRAKEGHNRKPTFSPEQEKLREALAKAVSAMPAEPPAKPQAEVATAAVVPATKPHAKPATAAVAPPAKPKAEPKPAAITPPLATSVAIAGTIDDRDRPTIGPRNLAVDPHEVRTLTQIAPPTHTTGEKGSAAKGQNRTARRLLE